MNETLAGLILMVVVFGGAILLAGDIQPDLSTLDLPMKEGSAGHPLYSD